MKFVNTFSTSVSSSPLPNSLEIVLPNLEIASPTIFPTSSTSASTLVSKTASTCSKLSKPLSSIRKWALIPFESSLVCLAIASETPLSET